MALDYVETSKKIIEAVGGAGNISSAGNCMTRLRLVLKDDKKANDEKVQSIKGVKGVMRQGGQYQIIIGNEVSNLFKEFKKHGNWGEDGGGAPQKAEGNPVQRLFGFVSGCMTPMLPAMLGTGMLKVVLTLLTTFCGMSTESSTYILLFSFADCFFMFLPVFLGMTLAKKMGGSPIMYHINAPCDGTISTFFDTGHAFGLTADSGVEFLIHVGMDTIKLNGKGFTPMVKEGDRVRKGQLLLKFDIAYIKSQGLPVTTPVVVSNTDDFSAVDALASGKVDLNTKLLQITK